MVMAVQHVCLKWMEGLEDLSSALMYLFICVFVFLCICAFVYMSIYVNICVFVYICVSELDRICTSAAPGALLSSREWKPSKSLPIVPGFSWK